MMTKKLPLLLFALLTLSAGYAQKRIGAETDAQKEKRMEWWQDDRFGMFIHWGLYSGAARHEWVKHNEKIDNAGYQKYFDQFNPDLFDPQKWAREAKAAGMKYAGTTNKQQEGFCNFDSKYTDYKAPNTHAKRDLVREYVDAFRAQGLKIGFYYSLLDWHHPDYTIDEIHPQSPADKSDTAYAHLNKGRDMAKYRGETWDTCQTFSGSWGYYRDENTWKTHRQLLDLLITSVSNGGNLILNVGPTARGEFDYRASSALDSIAYWMHANSTAIYHCTYAPDTYTIPENTKLSYNKATKRLYVFLYNYPENGKLTLPGYKGKIKYAQFLNDHSELLYKPSEKNTEDLEVTLPLKKPGYEIPVVELTL